MNREYNFNFGWKFCDHDCDGKNFDRFAGEKYKEPQWVKVGNHGLAVSNFDDSNWSDVRLPHDFVIEKCDFTNEESDSVGCLRKGKVWYRKTFKLSDEMKNKRVFIRFDGVFRDSQVWCNGHFMGRHLGGYLGFSYELTEVLKQDGDNTIAVSVDATGYEGWWYEGGGIYRDSFLIATESVRIAENGVFIKPYNIDLENNSCNLDIQLEFDSNNFTDTNCVYSVDIFDPNDVNVATIKGDFTALPLSSTTTKTSVKLSNISLWDTENPVQYSAKVSVQYDDKSDIFIQKFGIRKFTFSPEKGLFLNGKNIYLKGVCGHDDLAGVGTALSRSTMEYKIKTLQSMGCNSYRCSHNPPSPVFLDLCDELGFIVMDEHRLPGTSYECIDDFKNLIKRDRNHPSIIFYSMGNEEMGIQDNKVGIDIFSKLIAIGEQLDDSRDFLFAINCNVDSIITYLHNNGYKRHIHGVNYLKPKVGPLQHEAVTKNNPESCFVSTETSGVCSIRGYSNGKINRPGVSQSGQACGVWYNKKHDGEVTCYGDCGPFWGLTPEEALKEHDGRTNFLGQYLWTGFDYRGEVFPYQFPQVISTFGILDLCGFYKDWAYYMRAWWRDEPLLHIFPSWNLPFDEGSEVSVWAFSNCDEVELFINGVSQGRKSLDRLSHLEWNTIYKKGELKAIGYKKGAEILTKIIVTSEEEYQLTLSTDKTQLIANHSDSTMITVEVVDKNGNLVTDSEIDVDFSIIGNANIIGVGNGDPKSHEHDKAPKRKLFAGKAMLIVESTFDASQITVVASSPNIKSAEINLVSTNNTNPQKYVFSSTDNIIGNMREQYIDL